MYTFLAINPPLFIILNAVFVLLLIGQTLHLFFCVFFMKKDTPKQTLAFVAHMLYEGSLMVFLIGASLVFRNPTCAYGVIFDIVFPNKILLYSGIVPLFFGIISLAAGRRTHFIIIELVLFAISALSVLVNNGTLYLLTIIIIEGALVFQIVNNIQDDEKLSRKTLTHLSMVDAINLLPSGILCLTDKGYPLIMNQSMRSNLISLGLPTDTADFSDIWERLEKIALTDDHSLRYNEQYLLLALPQNNYYLFERGTMNWKNDTHLTITSTDVTEEEELNQLIERSNDLIAAAGEEIKSSLDDIQRIAQNEALLSLRAKIHDIIGQRLSILHRLLEDDNLSDESLAEIKPLLHNLLADVSIDDFDAQTELSAIVSAFSLINVTLCVNGNLPNHENIARAFVSVIREASTNAVKHAQAMHITITLQETTHGATLTISNDLGTLQENPGEGIGIPHMRAAIENLNGTLEIQERPIFVVTAHIPYKGSEFA